MFRNLASAASQDLCPVSTPSLRTASPGVQHTEIVNLPGFTSQLKVVCKSGQLHVHWNCACGSAGVQTPFGSVESAVQAAYAAVGRHHLDRHNSVARLHV